MWYENYFSANFREKNETYLTIDECIFLQKYNEEIAKQPQTLQELYQLKNEYEHC